LHRVRLRLTAFGVMTAQIVGDPSLQRVKRCGPGEVEN
jgi:hypothetical protein